MTSWTAGPGGGRARGPVALGRAWVEVLLRPDRFFRTAVAPGDQAPGLAFAMAVVLVEEATRLALTPAAVPPLVGSPALSALVVVAVAVLVVTPVGLHLVAALATLGLAAVAEDRRGVGETVQVVAYAAAPCALAGLPYPGLRIIATAYGAYLLVVGIDAVHGTGVRRATVAGALPAVATFGYGFRGFDAVATLLARWYVI